MKSRVFIKSVLLGTGLLFFSHGFSEVSASSLPGFVLPKPESEYDQALLKNITQIGWHHVHVQAEGRTPAYAFSLGLYANYGHPEIIVFGLSPHVAQQLLNIIAAGVVGAKSEYETFKPYENIARGTRIAFIPVAKKFISEYFGYGRWFYQSTQGEFPALQMVWPDRQGRLPWEESYDAAFSEIQPLLDK